jgi:hypothetical protein
MNRIILTVSYLLFTVSSIAQITFEKIYGPGSGIYVNQCKDDGYIIGGSDAGEGYLLKVNMNGDSTWIHTGYLTIPNAVKETIDNGFVFVGSKIDTTVVTKTYSLGSIEWTTDVFDSSNFYGRNGINIFQRADSGFSVASQEFRFMQNIPYIITPLNTNGVRQSPEFEILIPNYVGNLSASKVHATSDKGFVMTGAITSTGVGVVVTSVGKLDSTGTEEWNNLIADTNGTFDIAAEAVVQTSDGSYYIGGNSNHFTGDDKMYVMNIDAAGDSLWTAVLGIGQLKDIAATNDNGVIVVCDSAGSSNIHLMRLDNSANILWRRSFTGSGTASASHIFETSDKGFVIIGETGGNVYLIKTDSLGRILPPSYITVTGNLPHCEGFSVMLSVDTGYSYLWSNGDTTSSVFSTLDGNYSVVVTDSTGLAAQSNIVSVTQAPAPIITQPGGLGTLLHSTPGLHYQWFFETTLITGADSSTFQPISWGNYYVAVEDFNGCFDTSLAYLFITPGISEIKDNLQLVSKSFYDHLEIFSSGIEMILSLYDINGKKIKNIQPGIPKHSIVNIDIQSWTSGIYILEAIDGNTVRKQKVNIIK